jgi:hypothetical protein
MKLREDKNLDIRVVVLNILNKHFDKSDLSMSDIEALLRAYNTAAYVEDGDFTVAMVYDIDGNITAVGASKRHHSDKKSPIRGHAVALARAIFSALQQTLP